MFVNHHASALLQYHKLLMLIARTIEFNHVNVSIYYFYFFLFHIGFSVSWMPFLSPTFKGTVVGYREKLIV